MSLCWQRSCDEFVHCVPCCYSLTADGASSPPSPYLVCNLPDPQSWSLHSVLCCEGGTQIPPTYLHTVTFLYGCHLLCLKWDHIACVWMHASCILIIAMIFQRIWRRIGNWGDSGCARGDGLLPPRLHFCFSFFLSWPLSYQPRSSLILFTVTLDSRGIFYFCNYNISPFLPSLQTLPYTLLLCFKFMNPILSVISCNYIVYTYLFT